MLVFIDETGDAGFKLDKGASPLFVAVMVVFRTGDEARLTQDVIRESRARKLHRAEFKFSKTRFEVKDLFFQAVKDCPFSLHAIVVRKARIEASQLRSGGENFYIYFLRQMMPQEAGLLHDARVIIDGSGKPELRKRITSALRGHSQEGAITQLRFQDSRSDVLIQLADMCSGAIARSYRPEREHADRWRKMIEPRLANIWEF